MLNHLDLFTLVFAPVIAYLAAALIFSAIERDQVSEKA